MVKEGSLFSHQESNSQRGAKDWAILVPQEALHESQLSWVMYLQATAKDAARDPRKAAKQVGNKAEEGAEKAQEAAGSAKEWISEWQKGQK